MSDQTGPARGYYSIIQYVPNPERAEGANVGVVLLCGERDFFQAQTAPGNDRIRRFFGPDVDFDLDRINALKAAFEERVAVASDHIRTLEEFRHFIATRANQLLLTEPRPVKISEPEADLANLFEALIGGRQHRVAERQPSSEERLTHRFGEILASRGLADKVLRDIVIEWPVGHRDIHFPFAFRNGILNVVQTVSFEHADEWNFRRGCELALEGEDLAGRPDEPTRLRVLGRFQPGQQESVAHVRALLRSREVTLLLPEEFDELADEVEKTVP